VAGSIQGCARCPLQHGCFGTGIAGGNHHIHIQNEINRHSRKEISWREPGIFINNFNNCREANYKWKTTEEAAMAAEMAVESTAQEEIQTEDRHQTVLEDHLEADHQTAREDHSERTLREEVSEVTVRREELMVRTPKEEASVETVHKEDHSERSLTERGHMERIRREGVLEATVLEDHVSETGQREQNVRREGHSENAQKEEVMEIVHRENLQEEKTSATSAMKRRAASAR
jgi:hypothetical protein